MLYKRSGSKNWWIKFAYHKKLYQFSSGTTTMSVAEGIEINKRSELRLKELGTWVERVKKAAVQSS